MRFVIPPLISALRSTINTETVPQMSWSKIRSISGFILIVIYDVTSCRLQEYRKREFYGVHCIRSCITNYSRHFWQNCLCLSAVNVYTWTLPFHFLLQAGMVKVKVMLEWINSQSYWLLRCKQIWQLQNEQFTNWRCECNSIIDRALQCPTTMHQMSTMGHYKIPGNLVS